MEGLKCFDGSCDDDDDSGNAPDPGTDTGGGGIDPNGGTPIE